jgi:hypothetical protein
VSTADSSDSGDSSADSGRGGDSGSSGQSASSADSTDVPPAEARLSGPVTSDHADDVAYPDRDDQDLTVGSEVPASPDGRRGADAPTGAVADEPVDEVAAPTGGGPGAGLDIGATPVSAAVPGPAADHESMLEDQGPLTPATDGLGADVPFLERGRGGPFADEQTEVIPFADRSDLELDAAGHANLDAYLGQELPGYGKTRLCTGQEPEFAFQRAKVGDTEYEIAPEGAPATWADGVDSATGAGTGCEVPGTWKPVELPRPGFRAAGGAQVRGRWGGGPATKVRGGDR